MVRIVNREYLLDLVEQNYKDQEKIILFTVTAGFVVFAKNQRYLKKNLEKNSKNLILKILMLLFER